MSLDGFKDGNQQGYDYDYDANGNLRKDLNKGIALITYNHLNLPVYMDFRLNKNITYIYNALGVKLIKRVSTPEKQTETVYSNGFQYQDTKLQLFPTAEGYVSVVEGKINYVYNYTDHLGNIRLSYGLDPEVQGQLKILSENHYYPYGLKHSNYNAIEYAYKENELGTYVVLDPTQRSDYRYKYNGKEYQDELGLNLYDYGARNYEPALGRWMNIDPLAEKFFQFSPYNYVTNSPIGKFDPDGMDVYFINDEGQFTLALRCKGKDVLYSTYEDELGFTRIDFWDGSLGSGTTIGGGIEVENGILSQLLGYKTTTNGHAYYSAVVDFNSSNENTMLKLFHFLANNTNVEFSMNFFINSSNKKQIVIGTFQLGSHSPGRDTYGINNNSQIIKAYHNHPKDVNYTETYTERKSMGDLGRFKGGDALKAIKFEKSYPNYVFFPESTNLYNVTMYGILYIQKINNNYKNLRQ